MTFRILLPHADSSFLYGLAIQTGKQLLAGTPDSGVYVTLVGSGGHTGKIYIHSALTFAISKKYIGRGTIDFVIVKSKADHDLGEVLVVILGIDKNRRQNVIPDPWFVDCVYVYNFQTKKPISTFPCYHWIGSGDSVSFTAHTSKPMISYIIINTTASYIPSPALLVTVRRMHKELDTSLRISTDMLIIVTHA